MATSIMKKFMDEATAAINKKVSEPQAGSIAQNVDPTQQAQATSAADVEAQDAKTRLWQSLNNTYNQQRKQSNESYDQAISQTDRQMLSRGMQRSSYAGQTLANMQQKKIEAENQITGNQIADYQNRLTQLEQQEKEEEWREKQFDYQQSRDTIADEQWQKQFDAQQEQWKQQFEYNKKTADQQIAYNYIIQMLEKGDNPSDELLARAGISRKDYNQMKTSMKSSGGGGGRKPNTNPTTNPNDPNNPNTNPNTNPTTNPNSSLGIVDQYTQGTQQDRLKKNTGRTAPKDIRGSVSKTKKGKAE